MHVRGRRLPGENNGVYEGRFVIVLLHHLRLDVQPRVLRVLSLRVMIVNDEMFRVGALSLLASSLGRLESIVDGCQVSLPARISVLFPDLVRRSAVLVTWSLTPSPPH